MRTKGGGCLIKAIKVTGKKINLREVRPCACGAPRPNLGEGGAGPGQCRRVWPGKSGIGLEKSVW